MQLKDLHLKQQKVILRVDFNVPIDSHGVITDDTRIVKSLPTIQYLQKQGCALIIMSHLGRPLKELNQDGSINLKKFSLRVVANHLSDLLNTPVAFADDCGGAHSISLANNLQASQILLLENTRFIKGEEKGDVDYAKTLAALGSFYINDAFGAAHREHASTATIARYFDKSHKAFGLLMNAELANAKHVMDNPKRPLTAIIGGAKVSDKIELISNLISLCDNILIGGGMAYTFLAAQGYEVGKSLCEVDKKELALSLIEQAKSKGVQLLLPLDSIAASTFDNNASFGTTPGQDLPHDHMGLDIGIKTIQLYTSVIQQSKTILWNGPMGVFEFSNFEQGTKQVALAVAHATKNGAFSLIGGGDSVAAINKYELDDDVSFVSTGGGAMLELLEGKVLPGVEAILS